MLPHLSYLDAPDELASIDILTELGVTIGFDHIEESVELHRQESNRENKWLAEGGREYSSSASVVYTIITGHIFFDIRDSGDYWIRCSMTAGSFVRLPAGVFHRALFRNGIIASYALAAMDSNVTMNPRFPLEKDGFEIVQRHSFRALVCELCQQFFVQGWVTGTGGSISIRFGNRIFMTPSGVQKERIQPEDLFVLDVKGNVLAVPSRKPGSSRPPKLSECAPLFLVCFNHRKAGAALHSHDMNCNLVCMLARGNEFRIKNQEMIKGIAGYGYADELVIPIIENTPHEYELTASLEAAVLKYPKAVAVLVRHHGVYVWGNSWEDAKRHGECLHYLFELSLRMCQFVTAHAPSAESVEVSTTSSRKRPRSSSNTNGELQSQELIISSYASSFKHVVLDIEGTTTPITFVKDVLFPYCKDNVESYLKTNWNTESGQRSIRSLLSQHAEDRSDSELLHLPTLSDAPIGSTTIPLSNLLLQALVTYVIWNIEKDRKIKALKDLQGIIWQKGYDDGRLQSIFYDDVPGFLKRMRDSEIRVAIYSSGSRGAQRLLFKHSNHGDLRTFISCYFDTAVGHKRTSSSYKEIALSLGVDSPSEILFVTDIFEEAEAAKEAGLSAVLSIRPGNAPLTEIQSAQFKSITSFDEL